MLSLQSLRWQRICLALVALIAILFNTTNAQAGFGFDAGAFAGLGSRGNESDATKPDVWSVGGYLNGGVTLGPWIQVGGYFEYVSTDQRDPASQFGGDNFGGTGWAVGPSVAFKFGPLILIGAYSLAGSYEFSNLTTAGLKSELESAQGVHVILGVEVIPMLSIDLGYTMIEYSDNVVGGVRFDISGDKATYESIRLGFSIHL